MNPAKAYEFLVVNIDASKVVWIALTHPNTIHRPPSLLHTPHKKNRKKCLPCNTEGPERRVAPCDRKTSKSTSWKWIPISLKERKFQARLLIFRRRRGPWRPSLFEWSAITVVASIRVRGSYLNTNSAGTTWHRNNPLHYFWNPEFVFYFCLENERLWGQRKMRSNHTTLTRTSLVDENFERFCAFVSIIDFGLD